MSREVICINDSFSELQRKDIKVLPIKDSIYSIRDLFKTRNGLAIHLKEIVNPNTGWTMVGNEKMTFEPSFSAKRFTTLLGEPITAERIKIEIEI